MAFVPSYQVQDITFSDETSASLAASVTSDIIVFMGTVFSIQVVYTGSPTGTVKLEYSLDKTNWSDVAGSDDTISGSCNTLWSLVNMAVPYVRIVYTRTSGTGTMTAKGCGKHE